MRTTISITLCLLITGAALRPVSADEAAPGVTKLAQDHRARAARRVRATGIALTLLALGAGLPLLVVGAHRLDGADGGACCRDTMPLNSTLVGIGVPLTAALIPGAILWSAGERR